MTADRVHQSARTELQKDAPDHLGRVAEIGISPAVRIAPVGVKRHNLGRRSTVFVFPSYSRVVLTFFASLGLGERLMTTRCEMTCRFEVEDLARC
jgi:hypothetical protein